VATSVHVELVFVEVDSIQVDCGHHLGDAGEVLEVVRARAGRQQEGGRVAFVGGDDVGGAGDAAVEGFPVENGGGEEVEVAADLLGRRPRQVRSQSASRAPAPCLRGCWRREVRSSTAWAEAMEQRAGRETVHCWSRVRSFMESRGATTSLQK